MRPSGHPSPHYSRLQEDQDGAQVLLPYTGCSHFEFVSVPFSFLSNFPTASRIIEGDKREKEKLFIFTYHHYLSIHPVKTFRLAREAAAVLPAWVTCFASESHWRRISADNCMSSASYFIGNNLER
ncbi:serine/threonine-protein phosphatase BSL3-like [Gossypium australe]|uniref:Serine/threonine-protein phosphatase BSL3-like n=1 Tax=Gossypium australe TaxID=47621 RepID=A0A5B6X9Z6_9ROSI|nr:serine/threonine-protein phosphatase BSL3-like [Gossypium australe]